MGSLCAAPSATRSSSSSSQLRILRSNSAWPLASARARSFCWSRRPPAKKRGIFAKDAWADRSAAALSAMSRSNSASVASRSRALIAARSSAPRARYFASSFACHAGAAADDDDASGLPSNDAIRLVIVRCEVEA